MSNKNDLNNKIINASKEKNKYSLVELYAEAMELSEDTDFTCFLATQAYVLALESNHPLTKKFYNYLILYNREE